MEPGENHANKRSRMGGSSANASHKIGRGGQQPDDDDDDAELKGVVGVRGGAGLRPWHHPASRIYRVSRASGGKDRHSKVYTAKGLRDRRVRLSVSTAIQFYDLQDRLGFDQPSKAIEWLINSAAAAIAQLPTLESSFPEPPKLGEKIEMEHGVDPGDDIQQQNQHLSLTKSGCSSTSETSKGSVLSLSRSESRIKARERARERAAKDKEKDQDDGHPGTAHQSISPTLNSQSSFTELLIGGGSSSGGTVVTTAQMNSNVNCTQKQIRYMPVAASSDYFSQAGLFGQACKAHHSPSSGFASPHLGNSSPVGMVPFNIAAAAAAAAAAGDHLEMQQFSLLQEPIAAVGPGDYNLNFSISSGLAGFNRGTLQSNSPSQLPHHHFQRLSPPVDGSNLPFFFGAAAPAAAATSAENQFLAGFDGRLQLCYGDGYRHADLKGKGKN